MIKMPPAVASALPGKPADMPTAAPTPHTSIWERPGFLVRRLHQIHVAIFLKAMSEENVTAIQYGLLSILLDRPGLDQLSVAKELGIDRANVGDILKRLEQRRLLTRVVDPNDKRRKICLPTRDGIAFVHKFHENMQQAQERLLEPLNPEERRTFMTLLRRLVGENNDVGRAPLTPPRGGFAD
jgi:DNA-binding MarR family transcriptional regulator